MLIPALSRSVSSPDEGRDPRRNQRRSLSSPHNTHEGVPVAYRLSCCHGPQTERLKCSIQARALDEALTCLATDRVYDRVPLRSLDGIATVLALMIRRDGDAIEEIMKRRQPRR